MAGRASGVMSSARLHVRGCADERPRHGQRRLQLGGLLRLRAIPIRHELRDAEVEHLGFDLAARQQDVLGLEVAMQDALLVRGLDRRADRRQDFHRPGRLEPSFAVQHPPQILAAHELHPEAMAGGRARLGRGSAGRCGRTNPTCRTA